MSFTKKDRKVQSKYGESVPTTDGNTLHSFPEVIGATLRAEFGGSASSVKTVARLTQANERAVKNWFDGKNGPSGENLVSLISHSDAVLKVVLNLAKRREPIIGIVLANLRDQLIGVLATIDELQPP